MAQVFLCSPNSTFVFWIHRGTQRTAEGLCKLWEIHECTIYPADREECKFSLVHSKVRKKDQKTSCISWDEIYSLVYNIFSWTMLPKGKGALLNSYRGQCYSILFGVTVIFQTLPSVKNLITSA